MPTWLIAYAVAVAGLVIAEFASARMWQCLFKSAAALGFCQIALHVGALSSLYGQLIFAALVVCAAGDIFLLSRESPSLFKLGMAAFASGHLIYVFAFIASAQTTAGLNLVWGLAALVGMGAVAVISFQYMKPHMPAEMRGPVAVYNVIITAMVVTAIATQNLVIIVPAIMFAVSDIFVGRDRFVSPGPYNALAISPLYFGAQVLFALSVG